MSSQLYLEIEAISQNKRECSIISSDISPLFLCKNGSLFEMDSLEFLKSIPSCSIDMIFADPPYNINKAEWDRFESQDDYISWSILWIKEASRILKKHGSMYICGFSEILADLKRPSMDYFKKCKWLIWCYRNKANLGNDWGRSHESILLLRKSDKFVMNVENVRIPYSNHTLKYPVHPQAESSQYSNNKNDKNIWSPNPNGAKPKDVFDIPTTCNGMNEKTPHPTQKPEELLRKLVLASSNKGDTILDPFSGSGTTLVVAEQLGRKWVGCDKNSQYNQWAIERIKNVARKSEEEWIQYDRKNQLRRSSIR